MLERYYRVQRPHLLSFNLRIARVTDKSEVVGGEIEVASEITRIEPEIPTLFEERSLHMNSESKDSPGIFGKASRNRRSDS